MAIFIYSSVKIEENFQMVVSFLSKTLFSAFVWNKYLESYLNFYLAYAFNSSFQRFFFIFLDYY